MNTDIHSHSDRTHEDDLDLSSIYPSPVELSLGQIIAKALLKNIPLFLITICLIFMVACTSTPKQESTGEYIDDTVITTRVKAAIASDDLLRATEVNVETYKGVVQLSGFVSSVEAQYQAVKLAKEVKGVKSVTNDMHVK
ncbi:hypothetical protein GCM10011613_22970 [Cellvibrio zantedeschiae]|uniref:BON domain-containing protein n=1 Tax=Cellvibrio zantedeschiae TaxID=1237077 RepID=A0ABQ3B4G1_9GAMM|nr:BON domain-containing protein [Cellvibrio zantedeschiae]GGY77796.1 hypothetical protein GCM10011613_22970 [Cellvibrio zantedeschiae]